MSNDARTAEEILGLADLVAVKRAEIAVLAGELSDSKWQGTIGQLRSLTRALESAVRALAAERDAALAEAARVRGAWAGESAP